MVKKVIRLKMSTNEQRNSLEKGIQLHYLVY